MSGHYYDIEVRHRRPLGFQASLHDFTVREAEPVSAGVVRDDPRVSLYCLDDAARQAIFVELPPEVDLATAPFIYQTQYEQAQRLIALPYAEFRQAAAELPEVRQLRMIYMTGRSGSTLLSRVLGAVPGVRSLSEPDAANQFIHLWGAAPGREAELRELLRCTVRFLFKPTAATPPAVCVLKLKSESTQLMDRVQTVFPDARNLFLYRDAVGWVQSFYRLFKVWRLPEVLPVQERVAIFRLLLASDLEPLTAYLDPGTTDVGIPEYLTLWWLAVIEWYLAQQARGLPVLAVRYADLNAHREPVVTAIFQHFGLSTDALAAALAAFDHDSQAGTDLAREDPRAGNALRLSDAQRDAVLRILGRHPVVREPDFFVPGTLRV